MRIGVLRRLPLLLVFLLIGTEGGVEAFVLERVSLTSQGAQALGGGGSPSISGDGRYVAFVWGGDDLVPGGVPGVYVRDRVAQTTELASVSSLGVPGNRFSGNPAMSADGRWIAFDSATRALPSTTTATAR